METKIALIIFAFLAIGIIIGGFGGVIISENQTILMMNEKDQEILELENELVSLNKQKQSISNQVDKLNLDKKKLNEEIALLNAEECEVCKGIDDFDEVYDELKTIFTDTWNGMIKCGDIVNCTDGACGTYDEDLTKTYCVMYYNKYEIEEFNDILEKLAEFKE